MSAVLDDLNPLMKATAASSSDATAAPDAAAGRPSSALASFLRIGVVGCSHGELDAIYDAVVKADAQAADGRRVDLLLCCGDFQAMRNPADLACMACPDKYKSMQSFWRYYSGVAVAPVPTLFIGGNHEATNHCAELPLGGWAAPNIFYLGSAGVINFGGLRVGGVSGIYKAHDFHKGVHERAPYTARGALHSANHQRAFDFWRLATLAAAPPPPIDIMLSHDWPEGVYNFGDAESLLAQKPFFREDMAAGALGSPPSMALLRALKPRFWFSGHLHCKFAAILPHEAAPPTRFLALDKPGRARSFLQVLDIPLPPGAELTPRAFHYDTAWATVAVQAHSRTPGGSAAPPLPMSNPLPNVDAVATVAGALARFSATARGATKEEADAAAIVAKGSPFLPVLIPPQSFVPSVAAWDGRSDVRSVHAPRQMGNPQTDALFEALGLEHITTVPCEGNTAARVRTAVGQGASSASTFAHSAADAYAAMMWAAVAAGGVPLGSGVGSGQAVALPVAVDANEIDIGDI